MDSTRTARTRPPAVVNLSVALWLGAILAGVAEALVHAMGPVPPGGAALAVRGGIYLVLAVLVVQLRTGRDGVRWTVVGVLGVLGTLSLVVEPARALLAGASAAEFLVTASGTELLAAALRALHLVEVLAALTLLFHPAARAFFTRQAGRPSTASSTEPTTVPSTTGTSVADGPVASR